MKSFKIIPLLFLPFFLSTTAHADSAGMTGTDILNLIEKDEDSKAMAEIYIGGVGVGLFAGLWVSQELSGEMQIFCFPKNMDGSQVQRILLKYLKEHPEEHHKPVAYLMLESFESFVCEKEE